jgi:muramoyltetrapeptide carboxypeptidase
LVGGNQDMVATTAGWALPSLDGVILLLEAIGMRLGHIDRQLTMLQNAGHLKGLKGIALGCYLNCDPDATTQGNWTAMDVLRDRLQRLNVPILGGLRLGHQIGAVSVPVGTMAVLDVAKGTLIVESGVA